MAGGQHAPGSPQHAPGPPFAALHYLQACDAGWNMVCEEARGRELRAWVLRGHSKQFWKKLLQFNTRPLGGRMHP